MKRRFFLLFLVFFLQYTIFASYLDRENAVVVIVPVTDSVGKPLGNGSPDCAVDSLYAKIPFSPESPNTCPRIRQFLYNEVGICTQITPDGTEACIEFPHVFYQTEQDKKEVHSFWVPAKNFMSVKKLKELEVLDSIPEPINCSEPFNPARFENILTLIMPWQDPQTKIVYSAGTRFKRVKQRDSDLAYGICMLDEKCKVKEALIEKDKALVEYPKDEALAKKLFVEILKKWAAVGPYKIAYAWGGCSFCCTYKDEFEKVSEQRGNDLVQYWIRPDACAPVSGFDCSGLILRAAQIAGLGYFYNNTTTLAIQLKDIDENHVIEDGDLIWFRGHVMVVADVKDNTMIEAVSYSSGYACVHEIPLAKAFENCSCYADLVGCFYGKKPLKLKNKAGNITKTVDSFRLLRNAYIHA